jgi:dienelactone hydrolase
MTVPTALRRTAALIAFSLMPLAPQAQEVTEFDLSEITSEPAAAPAAEAAFDYATESARVAADLLGGNAPRVRARFDDTMTKSLSEVRLNGIAAQVREGLGTVTSTGVPVVADGPSGTKLVTVPVTFERGALNIQVNWGAPDSSTTPPTCRISGLWLRQPDRTVKSEAPPYVDPAMFTTELVTVAGLPGKLCVPISAKEGMPGPAVVLVPGSGPNDMDSTIGANKPLRDLGEGLASAGVITLRYHKRTFAAPQSLGDPAKLTAKEEVVDDVLAALALLRERKDVDPSRIYVLGHSLGALMAPEIAEADGKLAGIVLLAAPAATGATDAIEQIDHIRRVQGGSLPPQALVQMERIRRSLESVADGTAEDSENVLGASASYWRDLARRDAAATAKRQANLPVFVVLGERDYQVPPAKHAPRWREAIDGRAHSRVEIYPALNHLMISGEGDSTPAEYETPGHVFPQLVTDIAAWIIATPPRK